MLIKGSTFWSIDHRNRGNSQRRVPYPHLPSAKSHRNECPVALLFALGSKPTVAGIRNTSLIIQEFGQGENTAFYQP
jgi:hypothetical protein